MDTLVSCMTPADGLESNMDLLTMYSSLFGATVALCGALTTWTGRLFLKDLTAGHCALCARRGEFGVEIQN